MTVTISRHSIIYLTYVYIYVRRSETYRLMNEKKASYTQFYNTYRYCKYVYKYVRKYDVYWLQYCWKSAIQSELCVSRPYGYTSLM